MEPYLLEPGKWLSSPRQSPFGLFGPRYIRMFSFSTVRNYDQIRLIGISLVSESIDI
jgi:hypothetical protein